eukprot:TRINITY_DN62991_c0_g1_i1.p1 TRINITY_DN62991_c0_g1~~TRINITY_DN62991_c0_g1_i1.p1  ORF type:complete len:108 (-),score=28.52 TRINITY_DN62991_c0_g1_i1:81-404(-)
MTMCSQLSSTSLVRCFFFNDTATTEIYTRSIVGSVRCVQETGINAEYMGEALLVRDLDRFDMIMQAAEYEAAQYIKLDQFFTSVKGKFTTKIVRQWEAELFSVIRSS